MNEAWESVYAMDFDFDIGKLERHRVHFHFNQFIGTLRISVDDKIVVKDFRMFDPELTKRYEFVVGENEKHDVAIEKTRKRWNGGARKQAYRVFEDGQLLEER